MMAPLDGGTLTTLATGQVYPWGIAVDANAVYWTGGGESEARLMKVAKP